MSVSGTSAFPDDALPRRGPGSEVLQCSTMKSIGVRELRQRASHYLRQVEAGRSFSITARGRAVALLVPPPASQADRLVQSRRVRPGTGDLLDLGAPLAPAPGIPLPSALLQRARAEER